MVHILNTPGVEINSCLAEATGSVLCGQNGYLIDSILSNIFRIFYLRSS